MNNQNKKLEAAFIFGFISLLLCGVGDWLIGYEPEGGEPLVYGITTTARVLIRIRMPLFRACCNENP